MPVRLTPVVKGLLIACTALFIFQNIADQFLGMNVLSVLALVPQVFVVHFQFWQIITYAFMHADVLHILLNMLMLVFIGGELESSWGSRRFLTYYLFCSTTAGFLYLMMLMGFDTQSTLTPMVGASGAIYGLLIAYGILYGERVMLFMMLFPMKAKHFIWILAGVEFFTATFSRKSGLSSLAHLGGMAGGFMFLWGKAWLQIYRRNQAQRPKKGKKKGSHLRLVSGNPKIFDPDSDDKNGSSGPKTWH